MKDYLDKWVDMFSGIGFIVSKWVLPKGKGKELIPPPYIVLGKDLASVSYADNKPYHVTEEITAMLINELGDSRSEQAVSQYLWQNGYNFTSAEGYDTAMEVHFREYKWTETVMYNEDTVY